MKPNEVEVIEPGKSLDSCNTPEAVENYRVSKIKELRAARQNRNLVRGEKLLTQREIINLNAKKKDLEIQEDKANNIIGDLVIEIELAKSKFFSLRD
jgi:hypothetical protein